MRDVSSTELVDTFVITDSIVMFSPDLGSTGVTVIACSTPKGICDTNRSDWGGAIGAELHDTITTAEATADKKCLLDFHNMLLPLKTWFLCALRTLSTRYQT